MEKSLSLNEVCEKKLRFQKKKVDEMNIRKNCVENENALLPYKIHSNFRCFTAKTMLTYEVGSAPMLFSILFHFVQLIWIAHVN